MAAGPSACNHERPAGTKRDPNVLDRMELAAARRVGLESATDAMQRGDLKQLKMLDTWVRKRAQVVLFNPDDLESLDLAISCLDGSLAPADREAALDKIAGGQLINPARDLCLEPAD
jgi:hypothetical protein